MTEIRYFFFQLFSFVIFVSCLLFKYIASTLSKCLLIKIQERGMAHSLRERYNTLSKKKG